MAIFQYHALTTGGRLMKGTLEAGSPDEAAQMLRDMDLEVSALEKAQPDLPRTSVGRNEFLLFNQQLASIAKAGVPLERGLRELAHDVASKSMRRLVEDIAADLEKGVPIEQAFEKRQKQFPPLYGRILKAGVKTGRLSEMLTSLNRHLELAGHTRRIIFEAVSYPAVILTLAAIIITGVFAFIIPQFVPVLQEMVEGRLNPVTTAVFRFSENLIPFWMVVGVLIGSVVVATTMLSARPAGRRFEEALFLRLPILGRLYHNSVLSRMAEAMAVLIGAGCDIPEALRLGAVASGSGRMALESDVAAQQIERGANILEAGQGMSMLPRLFLYSIQLGAQRNELQDNLYSLGQMYADQARAGQSRLQVILLPMMIALLGGIIAVAILAMFLPMIQVITSLSAAG